MLSLSLCDVSLFVVDQTPTPTKFLKSCEEVGLFQEINPFEKDFKKAVEQQQNEVRLKFIAVPVMASVFLSFLQFTLMFVTYLLL